MPVATNLALLPKVAKNLNNVKSHHKISVHGVREAIACHKSKAGRDHPERFLQTYTDGKTAQRADERGAYIHL